MWAGQRVRAFQEERPHMPRVGGGSRVMCSATSTTGAQGVRWLGNKARRHEQPKLTHIVDNFCALLGRTLVWGLLHTSLSQSSFWLSWGAHPHSLALMMLHFSRPSTNSGQCLFQNNLTHSWSHTVPQACLLLWLFSPTRYMRTCLPYCSLVPPPVGSSPPTAPFTSLWPWRPKSLGNARP